LLLRFLSDSQAHQAKNKTMKFTFYLLSLFFLLRVFPSCNRPGPTNDIGDVNACDSEIMVRNWEVTNPVILDSGSDAEAIVSCKDTLNRDQGDNMTGYADFSSAYDEPPADTAASAYTPFIKSPYTINGSYFFIDAYFHIPNRTSFLLPVIPAFLYTASVIKSDRDQDVIFIAGANNGLKLWLNGQLILRRFTTGFIQAYQYVTKVHLKKGDNFLLAKLTHIDGDWKFFLKLTSLRYANENSVGENYSSICEHYLVKTGDSLGLRIGAPEIRVEKPALLRLTDIDGEEVLHQRLDPARNWTLSTKSLKEGLYAVSLTTDEDTFKQYIFYGDYEKYFSSFRTSIEQGNLGGRFRENIDLLINRMAYVDTVKVEHDNEYERKVTRVLYEMTDMYRHFKKGDEVFADVPGLHLRSQLSPFYSSETYMIYMPETYRRGSPIPLVIMLPVETSIREFAISTYVAEINRVEYIMRLADKYGFAVLWSSFRVYTNHNLTRMVPDLVAKTLNSVKQDYTIDDNRIYAYGSCAGGELALFMANKYPSFFAAVGVEGPAIPDEFRTDSVNAPTRAQINYDFYNTVVNYHNFPTFIIHSINDEKTSFNRSVDLCRNISQLGGSARLDTLYVRKGLDLYLSDLMPNNKIMNDLFSFYNGKRKRTPDTVWLSTYQLKYNHAFWVSIDDLVPGQKATITAIVNRAGHSIHVQCSYVTAFTLNVHDLQLDSGKKTEVVVNNKSFFNDFIRDEKLKIDLRQADTPGAGKIGMSGTGKNETTEGPVNDFFSSPFLVVKGTKGTTNDKIKWQNAVDTLRKNWGIDYLRDAIPCKPDREIGQNDVDNYNLVLIGADSDNPLLHRLWQQIPLKVDSNALQIGSRKYPGRNLSYLLIYPNPLHRDKYVLVIGSNSLRISSNVLIDLPYEGWFDYEIYAGNRKLSAGYFNNNWK
jgi:hypothetical protein